MNKVILTLLLLSFYSTNLQAKKLDLQLKDKLVKNKLTINTHLVKTKKVEKKNYGFSGSFSSKTELKNAKTILGATVKWKPIPKNHYYFKVGLKHNFSLEDDKETYSWHLGYDDWHSGTWTTQINHWGGIKLDEGFDTYNAIGSIGYKYKSRFLKDNHLSSATTLSKRLGGDSEFKISTSLQWAPKQYWYIKEILVTPLNGDDSVWNYVFGYDDWHPSTWGFEYSNYNPNALYETNFKTKGKLAINYKWAF